MFECCGYVLFRITIFMLQIAFNPKSCNIFIIDKYSVNCMLIGRSSDVNLVKNMICLPGNIRKCQVQILTAVYM